MSHEPFETQAAAYALGALDGDERAQFEEHLAHGCAQCSAAVRDFGETLADVARGEPPLIPPAHVKTALMRRVTATATPAPRLAWRRWRWAAGTVAAAVVIAAFTAGFVASRYEARIGMMAREMATTRAALQRQEAALRGQLAASQAVVDLLRDPATRVVTLQGQGASPQSSGRLVWNEKAGGYLLVANLPPAPAGKAYELWTISGGKPQPAGLFTVDASGQGRLPVPAVAAPVDVFAVTLEPEAGVPAPTGPIVLASAK